MLKIVNNTVPSVLDKLGYTKKDRESIIQYIDQHDTIEGAPDLQKKHLPIFDCAFKPAKGSRFIHHMGHLRMMGAVQPFLSGAISKTVNMPHEATVEDIEKAYMEAWKLQLKSVALYRDGCKRTQPLNTSLDKDNGLTKQTTTAVQTVRKPYRRRLPDERQALTHKFNINGHEGYITVGLYEEGKPGEIFLTMAKEGSVVSGLMDGFATAISLALQYGVPLKILVNKFAHTRFEPSGMTNNPQILFAKSITDYIFRWLASKFLSEEDKIAVGVRPDGAPSESSGPIPTDPEVFNGLTIADDANPSPETLDAFSFRAQDDAPPLLGMRLHHDPERFVL